MLSAVNTGTVKAAEGPVHRRLRMVREGLIGKGVEEAPKEKRQPHSRAKAPPGCDWEASMAGTVTEREGRMGTRCWKGHGKGAPEKQGWCHAGTLSGQAVGGEHGGDPS